MSGSSSLMAATRGRMPLDFALVFGPEDFSQNGVDHGIVPLNIILPQGFGQTHFAMAYNSSDMNRRSFLNAALAFPSLLAGQTKRNGCWCTPTMPGCATR